jgi:uncharacterized protein DUF6320
MSICQHCGVELDNEKSTCPLCRRSIKGEDSILKEIQPLSDKKRKQVSYLWLMELFSFFSLTGFLIVLAVDLAYGTDLTWSRIPMAAVFFTWIFSLILFHFLRKPYLMVALETINLMIFLWLIDFFTPKYSWFLSLALPLILVIGIIFLLIILWIRSFKLSTLSAISVGTFAIGLLLICLEIILNLFHAKFFISWSIVVLACLLPVSCFFIYLQFRIKKKGSDLTKIFHI